MTPLPSKTPMLERVGRKVVRLLGMKNACFSVSQTDEKVIVLAHVPGTERLSNIKMTFEPEPLPNMEPKIGTYNR